MKKAKNLWELFTGFCSNVKKDIVENWCAFIKQNDFLKKFAFTYAVYFLGILSIIQANFLYKTDTQRVAETGASNWRHSGRFLDDLFVYIFHFDSYPRDISPLSQLIAIFFLALSSMILVRLICKKTSYLPLFFSTILGLSPYFLQIISYNFDCLFYCISVFFVIFPFLFYKNNKTFYLTSVLGIFLAYMSWQASISIYMIIVTYLFWNDLCDKNIPLKNLLQKIAFTTGFFLITSLLYIAIVHLFPIEDSVVSTQGDFCEASECWNLAQDNLKKATNYFFTHWENTEMGYAFLSIILLFTVYAFKTGLTSKRFNDKLSNMLVAHTGILCTFLMLFFIVLWTMFFTFIYWNARIWVGFGACFAVMMLAMTNEYTNWLKKIMLLFSILLTWGCITFATRVGNLMDIQKNYEQFVFTTLSQDMTQFPQIKEIIFKVTTIHSPIVKAQGQKYPILKDLVSGMQTKYFRSYVNFLNFYRPDLERCQHKKRKYKKILLDNAHHTFTQINESCVEINIK